MLLRPDWSGEQRCWIYEESSGQRPKGHVAHTCALFNVLLASLSKPDFIKMGKTHLRALSSHFVFPLAELTLFTCGLDKAFPTEQGKKEPQSACRDNPKASKFLHCVNSQSWLHLERKETESQFDLYK